MPANKELNYGNILSVGTTYQVTISIDSVKLTRAEVRGQPRVEYINEYVEDWEVDVIVGGVTFSINWEDTDVDYSSSPIYINNNIGSNPGPFNVEAINSEFKIIYRNLKNNILIEDENIYSNDRLFVYTNFIKIEAIYTAFSVIAPSNTIPIDNVSKDQIGATGISDLASISFGKFGNGNFKKGLWEYGVWNSGIRSSNKYIFDSISTRKLSNVKNPSVKGSGLTNRKSQFIVKLFGDSTNFNIGETITVSNLAIIDINGNRFPSLEAYRIVNKDTDGIEILLSTDFDVYDIIRDSNLHYIYVSKNIWLNGMFHNGIFGHSSDVNDPEITGDVWTNGIVNGNNENTIFRHTGWISGEFDGGYFSSKVDGNFHTGLMQHLIFKDNNFMPKNTLLEPINRYRSYLDLVYRTNETTRLYKNGYANNSIAGAINISNFKGGITDDILSSKSTFRNKDEFNTNTYDLGIKYNTYTKLVGNELSYKLIGNFNFPQTVQLSDLGWYTNGDALLNFIPLQPSGGGYIILTNNGTQPTSSIVLNNSITGNDFQLTTTLNQNWLSGGRYTKLSFDLELIQNPNAFLDFIDTGTFISDTVLNTDQNILNTGIGKKTIYFYNKSKINLFYRAVLNSFINLDNIEMVELDRVPFLKYFSVEEINSIPSPTFLSTSPQFNIEDNKFIRYPKIITQIDEEGKVDVYFKVN
jgi:hypothetical protein